VKEPYNETGVKLLMVAVLEEAIEDYRTLTPVPPRQRKLGERSGGRPRKCRWTTARDLLAGRSAGPGKMSMLDFFFSYMDGVETDVIARGVLRADNKNGIYDIGELRKKYSSVFRQVTAEHGGEHVYRRKKMK